MDDNSPGSLVCLSMIGRGQRIIATVPDGITPANFHQTRQGALRETAPAQSVRRTSLGQSRHHSCRSFRFLQTGIGGRASEEVYKLIRRGKLARLDRPEDDTCYGPCSGNTAVRIMFEHGEQKVNVWKRHAAGRRSCSDQLPVRRARTVLCHIKSSPCRRMRQIWFARTRP